jgi:thymidylate synthase (FAD)
VSIVKAKLIALTQPLEDTGIPSAEDLIVFCARVSNQGNQSNFETGEKLLQYCIRNKHWSIFEMANAVVEVKAPRDITRQLIRHVSLRPQEFSQRYSSDIEFCDREIRMQDTKNRQNSVECDNIGLIEDWETDLDFIRDIARAVYEKHIGLGVAKEVARVILPEGLTMSTMYLNGNLRSWLHYLDVREGNGTQKEHRLLANEIRKCLLPAFPKVLGMNNEVN